MDTEVAANDESVTFGIVSSTDDTKVTLINGIVTVNPDKNFNGDFVVTYSITDKGSLTSTNKIVIHVDAVEDNPTTVADNSTMDEDDSISIDVLANDSDIDSDPSINLDDANINNGILTITHIDGTPIIEFSSVDTANGSVTLESGILKYTPDKDYAGDDSFTYTAENSDGKASTATVDLTVENVNDAPTADLVEINKTEGNAATTIDLEEYTDDADLPYVADESLTYSLVSSTDDSKVSIEGSIVSISPDENFNGNFEVQYKVTDTSGAYATNRIIVNVTAVEDNPTAADDIATAKEETGTVLDLLSNDSDIDSDPSINLDENNINDNILTVIGINGTMFSELPFIKTTHGTVGNVEGNIVYYSDKDYVGIDTFTYTLVNSDGKTSTAAVSVTVTNVNDAPVTTIGTVNGYEGNPELTFDLDDISSDVDMEVPENNESLSYSLIDDSDSRVTIDDNIVCFNPEENFNGSYSVWFRVTDNSGLSAVGIAIFDIIAVEDNPTASDDNFVIDEDTTVTMEVLTNDSDIDSDRRLNLDRENINDGSLTITAVNGETIADGDTLEVTNGTVTLESDVLKYTPDADYVGNDSFTYTIANSDGNTSVATVYVTVANVNDTPIAEIVEIDKNEGNAYTTVDLKDYTDDADLPYITDEYLTYSLVAPVDNSIVSIDGSIITVNPDENFNGIYELSYMVTDASNASASNSISIDITAVEDNPTAIADSTTMNEDDSISIDVLANDSDIDSDSTINLDADNINNGILTITHIDGTPIIEFGSVDTANGSVTLESGILKYTSDNDYAGDDSFTYTVENSDGNASTAKVNVTVKNINDVPTAELVEVDKTEGDAATTIDLQEYTDDADLPYIDSEYLTYSLGSSTDDSKVSIDGSIVTIIPDENFNGNFEVEYTVTDADKAYASDMIVIHIAAVEDNPTVNDDIAIADEETTTDIDVLANDSDIDSDGTINLDGKNINDGSLTITAINGETISETESVKVAHGSVTLESGILKYTSDTDYVGSDSFTYTATNMDGNTATATVDVTVKNIDDAPVANDCNITIDEDAAPVTVDMNDFISDGDDEYVTEEHLTVSITAADDTDSYTYDDTSKTLIYTPKPDFNGIYAIEFTVTDKDGSEASASVKFTVNDIGDAPELSDDIIDIQEDSAPDWVSADLLANDEDVDLLTNSEFEDLHITSLDLPESEYVEIRLSDDQKTIEYKVADDYNGTYSFAYTVSDSYGLTDTAQVTLNIEAVDDAPVAADDSFRVVQGSGITVDLISNDSDIDVVEGLNVDTSDELTLTEVSKAMHGTAEIRNNKLYYRSYDGFAGHETLTYIVSDKDSKTAEGTVTITVTAIPVTATPTPTPDYNFAPAVSPDSDQLNPDTNDNGDNDSVIVDNNTSGNDNGNPDNPYVVEDNDNYFSVINLILAMFTVLTAAYVLLFAKKDRYSKHGMSQLRGIEILIAFISILAFILTEDITAQMILTDQYTWVFLVTAVIAPIFIYIFRKTEL